MATKVGRGTTVFVVVVVVFFLFLFLFFTKTATVKIQILILTVKEFQGISNLTISADLQGLLAPEESLSWKNQFPY